MTIRISDRNLLFSGAALRLGSRRRPRAVARHDGEAGQDAEVGVFPLRSRASAFAESLRRDKLTGHVRLRSRATSRQVGGGGKTGNIDWKI
jgi:hypothetical protein